MPKCEVIVITPADAQEPTRLDLSEAKERMGKGETRELARAPVPGDGPSRRVLWDRSSTPEEQAKREAVRLARLRGLS
jgi:hypothetical protein